MTVPQNVKLARHAGDLNDDGHDIFAGGSDIYNVKTNGTLVGDGSTDDTVALQAAIDAATASGTRSATLYFPPGTYLIGGALQDTGAFNGQIILPDVPIDSSHPEIVIRFLGASRPPFAIVPTQPIPAPGGYSILKSTLTGASGTASVISAGNTDYNNISVVVEDLVCIAPADPTMKFWNLQRSQGATVQDVMIWTADWLGGTLPTHSNATGITLPGDTQGNYTRVEGLSVRNFYTGVRGGDLVVASGVQVSVCVVGWENPAGSWPTVIEDIYLNGCLYGIRGTGGASTLDVLRYSHEHYPSDPTYATVYDLDDSSDYIIGAIRWWDVEWSVGPDHVFSRNSGANVSDAEVGPLTSAGSAQLAYGQWTSTVNITATTEATANTIVTASAFTADGSSTYLVESFIPSATKGVTYTQFWLYEGSSSIGAFGVQGVAGAGQSLKLEAHVLPAAGSRTYSLRGSVDAPTGTATGGAGGAGAYVPGFIRVTKV